MSQRQAASGFYLFRHNYQILSTRRQVIISRLKKERNVTRSVCPLIFRAISEDRSAPDTWPGISTVTTKHTSFSPLRILPEMQLTPLDSRPSSRNVIVIELYSHNRFNSFLWEIGLRMEGKVYAEIEQISCSYFRYEQIEHSRVSPHFCGLIKRLLPLLLINKIFLVFSDVIT